MRRLLFILLIAIFVISGCSAPKSKQEHITSVQPTNTNLKSVYGVVYGKKYDAVVTKVVDGDTIYVKFLNGFKGVQEIRLLGIDTPEIGGKHYQRFVGDRNHVAKWAYLAKLFTSQLNGKIVQVQFDRKAGLRGKYGRFLAYIYFNGADFNAVLLKKGYARVYPSDFSKKFEYKNYEEAAKKNHLGIWNVSVKNVSVNLTNNSKNFSSIGVKIEYINYNPTGNDNLNLDGEYVVVKNGGNKDVNLKGWELRDKAYHVYVFPNYVLHPGKIVRIHTGYGKNNATDLYWCMNYAVWNNNGDTAYLYTPSGALEDVYSYT